MTLRPGVDPLSVIDLRDREEGDWWDDRIDMDDSDAEESYWRNGGPLTIAESNRLAGES